MTLARTRPYDHREKPAKPEEKEIGMRTDIEFRTRDGLTLRGWHYLPDGGSGPVPTIVMAHGFSCVKEMFLDRYADVFVAAGLGVLVYDNRN
jgi:uncharacterized protein